MIIKYDIGCYERTLIIDWFEWWWEAIKDYPIVTELPEMVCDVLDEYYTKWCSSDDPEVYQTPCEEYMMGRLEEDYGHMWTSWKSVDWGEQ